MLKIKKTIVLLLTLLIGFGISQNAETDNLHCFTEEEVLAIDSEITELGELNDINEQLIVKYEQQLSNCEYILKQDSLLIALQSQEIELLKQNIEHYKEINKLVKPKWYENKWTYFLLGFGTLYISSEVAGNLK